MNEILLTGITLIYGKMEVLPIFYGSRESGSSSIDRSYGANSRPYPSLSWSSFLAGNTYEEEYKGAIECLARNLQKQSDLNPDSSTKIAKEALEGYLESVRLGPVQRVRGNLLGLLRRILPESNIRSLIGKYMQMNDMITNIRLRGVKKEYSDFLEKNDPNFHENLQIIRKAVIASKPMLLIKSNC